MGSQEHVCPHCGQPVDTVVKRHKTLGAWVPTWVGGPCRNPDCATYVDEGAAGHEERPGPDEEPEQPGTAAAKNS